MARLFGECGWTQEKIAARMGKRQDWVSRRLLYGRFLKNMSADIFPSNLTERRFRDYWSRTTGKEAERFAQVLRTLETGIPTGIAACHEKPGVRAAVMSESDFDQKLRHIEDQYAARRAGGVKRTPVGAADERPRARQHQREAATVLPLSRPQTLPGYSRKPLLIPGFIGVSCNASHIDATTIARYD